MNPLRVHHIALKVVDLAAAEAFYVGVLGLPVLRRWPAADGAGERSLWLDLGAESFLALERAGQGDGSTDEEAPGFHLVSLHIDARERAAWIAKLAQAGHPIYRETPHTIYVRDAEGNRIGLSHWPRQAGDL
jgi:catechol 2,3-dioxygenase-like lactoylglutathione lyase family enzyme